MHEIEGLGVFYLGKTFDPAAGTLADEPLLYAAKDLTTHAMIVGMTGSGKTGLAMAMLEEAALDGVPSILIDPKGDLGNLLLTFPNLAASDFRPWIDEADAARKGVSADEFAASTAAAWQQGLAEWGQDAGRVQRLRQAVDMAIYTPGNAAGRPLQLLRSFAAPAAAQDPQALRDRILSTVTGLLGLLGVDADPIQSREFILLSTIFERAWSAGRDLDLAGLIQTIQKPPFEKIGVFDLESVFPAKDRFGLAMRLNNLIASPGFSAWMEGEPLDVQRLLYTPEGRPRVSVLYLAHLSEAERMFFVTILLNDVLSWVRAQSGTSSLRALLYMDEIFGYFPPTANPPSKLPMLSLLKQARAFGLGVVLSTQNPVDLDYKGLSNCGTWFIGRLQTERDKQRVIEGLEGAAASAGGGFDRARMEQVLAGLGSRVFLMRNVHDDEAVVFKTRWALSYLRGPMTLPQIQRITGPGRAAPAVGALPEPAQPVASSAGTAANAGAGDARPALPPGVPECFLRPKGDAQGLTYRANILGASKLHFVDAKAGIDTWVAYTHLAPFSDDGREAVWEQATAHGDLKAEIEREPRPGARFAAVPAGAASPQRLGAWQASLEDFLYQTATLEIRRSAALKLSSTPGEAEGDFLARVAMAQRERRDGDVAKLRAKYAPKIQTLQDRLQRAEERVAREKAQANQQKMSTAISVGATLLGAMFGRRMMSASTVGRAASSMKSASRIGKESADVARADESVAAVTERLQALQMEFEQEAGALQGQPGPTAGDVECIQIRPRKSDTAVGTLCICWTPWRIAADGMPGPAF